MKTKPMTVAFVSDAVYPFNKGGKETRIHHLTTRLVALGFDVHIYTMHWWEGKNDYFYEGVTYHALSRLYPLYAGERRSISQSILFGLACLKMVRYSFDVLDVDQMPIFPVYAAKLVSIVKRRPLFVTWHEVWGRAYWQKYLGAGLGLIAYLVERNSVRLPDHIIAVSDHTKERLVNVLHYKGALSMVANGIDYKKILPIRAATMKSDVIYTGRLLAHKNVDVLIEAIALLRNDMPHIRCFIVGDGPERNKLAALIRRKKLETTITMTGFLESSDDVFAYMKASKVFVLPSSREGFGITVLEAYACNLSVVTVAQPDNAAQYISPKKSSIICSLTAEDIAAAIKQLLTRKITTKQNNAEPYDWQKLAVSLKEVYYT